MIEETYSNEQIIKNMPQDAEIIFEQPLNEHIRVCLRLEHLFGEIADNLGGALWQSRLVLNSILEVVNVTDRPDLKSKLANALGQHARALLQHQEKPGVNKDKLREVLSEIDSLIEVLCQTHDKIGSALRSNPFLASVRQQMTSPGGACGFNTPAYELWLQAASLEQRNQQLYLWFKEFDLLRQTTHLILKLTRQSAKLIPCSAEGGFYQQALDPNIPCQVIRIVVATKLRVYPEVSVGRHRLSIHFFDLNMLNRSQQSLSDIPFQLAVCVL